MSSHLEEGGGGVQWRPLSNPPNWASIDRIPKTHRGASISGFQWRGEAGGGGEGGLSRDVPSPPLAKSRGSARRSPGWGGRRSPSDGVPGGGGEIARVSQGKLWYPPLTQAKRTRVKRLSC